MNAPVTLQGKRVAVMGLGKSGSATVRYLLAAGAEVWAWDDNATSRAAAQADGIPLKNLGESDLEGVDLMVWSPGIPHTYPAPHPAAVQARAKGLRLVCDVELLARACPSARFIAITGTNGKSTTTTLLAHILRSAGLAVEVGGNLGVPALSLAPLGKDGIYVLEISSYQAELLDQATFDVAMLLNITPDHLARHGGMEGYAAAKISLFDRLRRNATAVIGVDDEAGRMLFERTASRPDVKAVAISAERALAGGVSAADGILSEGRATFDLRAIATLPGRHNWQNACAAYAAARAFGLDGATIFKALQSFAGLAHRQELIAVIDAVQYVNDSKATNADAVAKALVCYDNIYWILGGQAKEGGIGSLEAYFPRIRRAFLIGEAAGTFARTLAGKVAHELCGTLDVAVRRARTAALEEGADKSVVLLSPACASWDQFSSFEQRGDVFRQLVNALPGRRSAA